MLPFLAKEWCKIPADQPPYIADDGRAVRTGVKTIGDVEHRTPCHDSLCDGRLEVLGRCLALHVHDNCANCTSLI